MPNTQKYWPNARTRTSTLILVDYDNVVKYYEYNLTLTPTQQNNKKIKETWTFNNYTFQLKPFQIKYSNIDNLIVYFKKLLVIVFITLLILKF